MNAPMPMEAKAQQFQQEVQRLPSLFSRPQRLPSKDKRNQATRLLQGPAFPSRKSYGQRAKYYYRNQQNPGAPLKDPVMVTTNSKNEDKAGLGIPLPAGNVRVYRKIQTGGFFVPARDRIDHTAKESS